MIKRDGKGPKLRAKGAETRYLVPFALELAMSMHSVLMNEHSEALVKCFSSLMDIYSHMSSGFDPEGLKQATRNFLLFYKALSHEAQDEKFWKVKPKFHMVQELGEYTALEAGNPRDFWCYMDEDFVGFIAQVAMSRGGRQGPSTLPCRVVDRVRAMVAE